jgi:16S rRNA (uracil1498-N3)-methyltransferase
MNLFYHPEINNLQTIILSEEESTHAIRVLRMKAGDAIFMTDGKGMFYEAEIIYDNSKKCLVKIVKSVADKSKRNFHLIIAIAPTKSIDRFEWFLEKATEIGCDEIIPISCKHSERTSIKAERLNKVIVSAMKQCLKSQLPKLNELKDFKIFIESTKQFSGQKFIGHIPEVSESKFPPQNPNGKPLSKSLILNPKSQILICIGPEGGFSEDEVALAIQNGFTSISLGNSRLRVETAGVVACSVVNMMYLEQ